MTSFFYLITHSQRQLRQNPVYLLIYLHYRGCATGAEAFDGEQGEFAIGGGLAYFYGHEIEFLSGSDVLSVGVLKGQNGSLGNSSGQFITTASVCQITI